jgi:putative peptidoglycan lipid II flippase
MSRLTRISLLLAFFFGLDKLAAFLRQIVIARQFGLSHELDAFNVANNIPDLLYAVISGGALAIAFIPVLSATITKEGRQAAWDLFSKVANLFFLLTAAFALVIALAAGWLVRSSIGVAPGFGPDQQKVVIELMRLNLVATLIFSISGLVMAGLQANQHFLFPAMSPLFYNFGTIFGAVVLAPVKGYVIAGISLPAFGMGVYGLVAGVIIGSVLHLAIQIPGLILYRFRWTGGLGLNNAAVRQVIKLMGPRVLTVLFVQAIFLVRDNLASRLAAGAVTSLTYGWMLQQVPETLIGTAIGTAFLPALSELSAKGDDEGFHAAIARAVRVLVGIMLPIGVILGVGLGPLVGKAFNFGPEGTATLMWATRGFMAGLLGHSLMEIASRAFYARQDARTPLITGAINLGFYIILGLLLYRPLGPAGISLTDAICFTSQAVLLLFLMSRRLGRSFRPGWVLLRAVLAAVAGGAGTWLVQSLPIAQRQPLVFGVLGMIVGAGLMLPFIWREARMLLRL